MIIGKCEICGRPAVAKCRICGRLVCKEHYDNEKGVCVICLESLCAICRKRLAIGRCIFCKRPVCDTCSVQIDNVRRICIECLHKRFRGNIELARREVRRRSYYRIPEGPKRVTIKVMRGLK